MLTIIVLRLNLSIMVFLKDHFWAIYSFLLILKTSQILHLVILGFLLMIHASYLKTLPSQIVKKNCTLEILLLYSWCSTNKLEINPTKCAAIVIPDKLYDIKLEINILYNNQNITCCNSSKYMGVIIANLNFRTHIQNVENKVSRSVGFYPSSDFSSTLLQLYYALVLPYLLCGLLLWGYTFLSY